MWRYLAGGIAALLMAAAGMVLWGQRSHGGAAVLPAQPLAQASPAAAPDAAALPATVPEASERTREEKRFDRYDKDRDGNVTRVEYLAQRHKMFAKLDLNHDGTLSFDEWAAKTELKFATADGDRNSSLSRREFATTAVKRKPGARRACPPPAPVRDGDDEG